MGLDETARLKREIVEHCAARLDLHLRAGAEHIVVPTPPVPPASSPPVHARPRTPVNEHPVADTSLSAGIVACG